MSANTSTGIRSRSNKKAKRNKPIKDEDIKITKEVLTDHSVLSLTLVTAFRILFIVRCFSALFHIMDDCDEVYNYWEPTHYLLNGYGRETWEYSAEYKIRSWAYIMVHALVGFVTSLMTTTKIQTFYTIRLALAAACSFVEAKFYRTVTEEINPHVGRYVYVILFFSAGMFNASTAYLPSTFAMYCVFMAFSYSLRPVSHVDRSRTYKVVFWIGLGSLAGWPFAALIGIPFAIEEVLIYGRDTTNGVRHPQWRVKRVVRLAEAILLCGLGLTFILTLIDQMFYRQYTVVAWNIIKYNIFNTNGRGPDLYGTEPWYYYILNGILNFNIVFLLALGSALCVCITAYIDRNRVPGNTRMDVAWPYVILGLKLIPFYIWFTVFTLQAHKEERFMYVAYPLLALNAAISLFLIRSWASKFAGVMGADINVRVLVLQYTSFFVLTIYALLSLSRMLALLTRYRAPYVTYSAVWKEQAPDQLVNKNYLDENFPDDVSLKTKNVCVGKEWYRFPSQFFLPSDTRIQFLKSRFEGQLPKTFREDYKVGKYEVDGELKQYRQREYAWLGTRESPEGFNDLNLEDPSVYVDINACDYLVDSDFPLRSSSDKEPRYIQDTEHWDILECYPYLDNENSHRLARSFWIPVSAGLNWGQYCLLKRKD
ncbi:Alg9-like mannosyltransferase family-domain-containing protein [Pilobolus umbonatus]|nr:Alg9-like mannosyltransferase family-domain-containing protein [Pilobolus umbonatus]